MTRTITSVGSTIKGSRRSPAEIERGSWKIAARTAPTYTYARAVSRLCAQGGAAKSSPAGPTTARPLALLLAAQLLEAKAETLQCHADGWPRWRDSLRRNLAAQAPSSDTCSAFVRSISVATPTSLLRAGSAPQRSAPALRLAPEPRAPRWPRVAGAGGASGYRPALETAGRRTHLTTLGGTSPAFVRPHYSRAKLPDDGRPDGAVGFAGSSTWMCVPWP